jgi:hypothetical protein
LTLSPPLRQIRNNYRNAAKELDLAHQKYERALGDDKAAEKAAKEWNEVLIEKIDRKNEYILSLASLNALKKKYFHTDMATLMDVSFFVPYPLL